MYRTDAKHYRAATGDRAVGYYDFKRFVVPLAGEQDQSIVEVAFLHEYTHHHLNMGSSFGLLLSKVAEATERGPDVEASNAALDFLADKCERVHEMIATYYSLTALRKRKLLDRFPAFYRECYARLDKSVQHLFREAPCLRSQFAFCLAKLAMLSTLYTRCSSASNFTLPFMRASLREEDAPDYRIERILTCITTVSERSISDAIRDWGAGEELEAALRAETANRERPGQYLRESLASNAAGGVYSFARNLQLGMLHALFALLSREMPELEDQYSDYLTLRMVASPHAWQRSLRYQGIDVGTDMALSLALEHCDQSVRAHDKIGFITETSQVDSRELENMLSNSLRKIPSLFIYMQVGKREVGSRGGLFGRLFASSRRSESLPTMTLYLTSLQWRDRDAVPQAVMKWYKLDDKEGRLLGALRVPAITLFDSRDVLTEADGENEIPTPRGTKKLLETVFAHIVGNPIDFLERRILAGSRIEWTVFRMGYQTPGSMGPAGGLQLCLCWVTGAQVVFFHLANDTMVRGLRAYTDDFIRDQSRIAFLPSDSSFSRLDRRLLALLIDHPVFNYYMAGCAPKIQWPEVHHEPH